MHTNLMYLHVSASFVELSECRRRPTHTKGSYPKRGQAEQLGEFHYVMYYFFIFVLLYLIFYRSAIHNTVTGILLKSLLPLKNSDPRQKIVILIDFIEKKV